VIARNASFVSINGALGVDLFGQVVADTLHGEQFSGVGGHEDFVTGAVQSAGGRSLLCLPSTAGAGEARVSRIVASLDPGTLVTTPRHHVDVIVTEHGAAELHGRTVAERARALLAVTHPDFRERIAREGARLGLPMVDTRGDTA
jgi:acyl-CoA hydrolase